MLRQKRIEREYAERKRASIVLAKAEIFGPLNALRMSGLSDGREQRYNQQFHPNIARLQSKSNINKLVTIEVLGLFPTLTATPTIAHDCL